MSIAQKFRYLRRRVPEIRYRIDYAVSGLCQRGQRFRRGWADVDALEFFDWFTDTIPEMLTFLANKRASKPESHKCIALIDEIYDLANDLRLMREENAFEVCQQRYDEQTGDLVPDEDDALRVIQEHKMKFFEKFEKIFWSLYI